MASKKDGIYIGSKLTGLVNEMTADCNSEKTCSNTDLDETMCTLPDNKDEMFKCRGTSRSTSSIPMSAVCDLKCDCYLCDDEAKCNNVTYGMFCNTVKGGYVHAMYICDKKTHCLDYKDERRCKPKQAIRKCSRPGKKGVRYLYPNQICAVPRGAFQSYACNDGLDQINCTDDSRVAMTCKMNGYQTTLSRFGLCMGYDLCSDGYNNLCEEAETGCVVHRNQICDGRKDCKNGADERKSDCNRMTNTTQCVRRLKDTPSIISNLHQPSPRVLTIPLSWVMDGHKDCVDGTDEEENLWFQCGYGVTIRYQEYEAVCRQVFLCPEGGFTEYTVLCSKQAGCGIEGEICEKSKGSKRTWNKVMSHENGAEKYIAHCVLGLETMSHLLAPCITSLFEGSSEGVLGVTPLSVTHPSGRGDCSYSYGERYVYLSCTGLCQNAVCPLSPLKESSCVNIPTEKRIFSLTKSYELTIVRKQVDTSSYFSDYFACTSETCIPYSKVCDLANDCGDWSDEKNCSNHFYCSKSGDHIPLSSLCDGKYDCSDLSDECGQMCDTSSKQLIQSNSIKIMAWIIGGLAVGLNGISLVRISRRVSKSTSFHGRIDKTLIMLVSFGDFLIGVYLLSVAVADLIYSSNYCKERFVWLTSHYCGALGVLSTIGSQLSLFSMTALSISRVYNISSLVPKDGTSFKAFLKILAISSLILGSSISIAIVPLFPSLEDYFVNGLYYGPVTLFTGMVNRDTHNKVLQVYYGRYKSQFLSWKIIQKMTGDMFSKDYNYKLVSGDNIEFYGNDGVCLFKYLVSSSDPQKVFSLVVLLFNFVCFLLITVCYCIINFKVKHQTSKVIMERTTVQQRRTQTRLNAKVSVIIVTDFLCWIPFIFISLLHFFDVIGATSWYPIFSIIILPMNSVINPLLYDDAVELTMRKLTNFIYTKCYLFNKLLGITAAVSVTEFVETEM